MSRKPEWMKRQEIAEASRKAMDRYLKTLASVNGIEDALKLIAHPPAVDTSGRPFASNFAFFWGHEFMIPGSACEAELREYLGLVRRLDANGELKPGALADVERRLTEAMRTRP
jgi:hypothetical protein